MGSLSELARALDPSLILDDLGYDPDEWQRSLLRSRSARSLVLAARQVGKTAAVSGLALRTALDRPGSLVVIVSPSLRQSNLLFDRVTTGYQALGRPVAAHVENAVTLGLANGSKVVSLPASEGTIRGYAGVDVLLIDEAARVPDPVYFAVLPMLAVSRGRLVALSTPFGRRGWYHDAWHDGSAAWHRIKVRASDCPRLDPAFLAEQRTLLGPRWYAQEWECSFEETEGQVFDNESIAAMLDTDEQPLFALGG